MARPTKARHGKDAKFIVPIVQWKLIILHRLQCSFGPKDIVRFTIEIVSQTIHRYELTTLADKLFVFYNRL